MFVKSNSDFLFSIPENACSDVANYLHYIFYYCHMSVFYFLGIVQCTKNDSLPSGMGDWACAFVSISRVCTFSRTAQTNPACFARTATVLSGITRWANTYVAQLVRVLLKYFLQI